MATQIGITSTGPGNRYNLGTTDDLIVLQDANIVSTNSEAITGFGSNHSVTVAGLVYGDFVGIDLGGGGAGANANKINISNTGNVASSLDVGTAAIRILGTAAQVVNNGSISGSFGLNIGGTTAGSSQSIVFNNADIHGSNSAIKRLAGTTEELYVLNTGKIEGGIFALDSNSSNATDRIVNNGLIVGDLRLAGGNDIYDGRGGTIYGTVSGGEDNDYFYAGSGVDVFDGGTGVDTLDFRTSAAGIALALDNTFDASGPAQGDTYTGIDNVTGSTVGADYLRGNDLTNALFGNGGADTLLGAGGLDYLRGGLGADNLYGGAGDDFYQYISAAEGGDFIFDYSSIAGNRDGFRMSAAGFGGGLAVGYITAAQLQIRADNVAQDADDRFIFRTTDNTLWFDVNGNAAGGLTLIADLQAGTSIVPTDIYMF